MSGWAALAWAPGSWAAGAWQSADEAGSQRLLPPVLEHLAESSAFLAFVGDPPRIWRHKRAPRSKVAPYCTWFVVSGVPENNLSDPPPIDRVTVQVDFWHTTDLGIEQMALAGRKALERFGHCTSMPIDERDTETNLYRIAMVFDLWLTRGLLPG